MSTSTTIDEVDTTYEATVTMAAQQQHQQQQLNSLSLNKTDDNENDIINNKNQDKDTTMMAILSLQDITEIPPANSLDGENGVYQSTTIPKVKFIDDISEYVQSFTPKIVTAELLIGAYTQLHTKYKLSETSLLRKRMCM